MNKIIIEIRAGAGGDKRNQIAIFAKKPIHYEKNNS